MRTLVPEELVGQFFGVGSLSETDPAAAKDYVSKIALPYAFQLPSHPEEDMIRQIGSLVDGYENAGGFTLDIDMYTFREIVGNDSPIIFDRLCARGLYEMIDETKYSYFKTQQTAPATMCFSIRDSNGQQLISKRMCFFFVKLLSRLAQGQVELLTKHCIKIILSQDDPALGFLIQALENTTETDLTPWEIVQSTDRVFPKEVIPSYHYCDDWRTLRKDERYLLWESKPKIIHIDLLTYPVDIDSEQAEAINAFLESGGGLALGILPNRDDAFSGPIQEILEKNLENALAGFKRVGVHMELLKECCMVSTQCGLLRASPDLARRLHIESNSFPEIFKRVVKALIQ